MTSTNPALRPVVVIPTYDERDNITPVVRRVLTAIPHTEVLIVDDASPDGTGDVADALAAADERVHVLHRPAKAGLGAAYRAGFGWALARGFDAIVEMDADGSHAPEDLPRLIRALDTADVVLGSRWVPGGQVVDWPRWRELLSRGGNRYTRAMLSLPLADATGGFRAFRSDAMQRLLAQHVDAQGYCFQIDMADRAVKGGLAVREVPIRFVERSRGRSKMSRSIVAEALWRVTKQGITQRLASRRAKHRPNRAEPLNES